MTPLSLCLIGGLLFALSGVPGLVLSWRSPVGQWISTAAAVAGSLAGLGGVAWTFFDPSSVSTMSAAWNLPGSAWKVELDALSAFFLVPVFLVGGAGSVYGLGYWKQARHPRTGPRLRFFWGTLVAGMTMLVLARNGILFLFGWEFMALSAFFLVGTEDGDPEVRDASWLYLAAAHVATLCLFVMFAIFSRITGSLDMRVLAAHEAGLGTLTVLFLLMVVAFGLKAGLMPFHIWLPSAHATAPSHVSAMLSGVVLKMGIYGLVRFLGYLPAPPPSWGAFLLTLGTLSGVLGVVFALGQHDLKRLLAYHSVENIGIIVMGLGLAMLGHSIGRPDWVLLGLGGCLLHVWNHGLFKSLLFLCAGPVVHGVRSRDMERMGGLAKPMPWTAGFFFVGAVAICGLPPLNGFVSELLIYVGLFRTILPSGSPSWPSAALAAPFLALIGALALACFVKAFGAVFLGTPRSERAAHAHEASPGMIGAMLLLAAGCAVIGLAPAMIAPLLDRLVAEWPGPGARPSPVLADALALRWISFFGVPLALLAVAAASFWCRQRPAVGTWDCGYARPSSRMQYTSSSFAQMIVRFFRSVLRPKVHRPEVTGLFPDRREFESHVDDVVLDRMVMPSLRGFRLRTDRVRGIQQGLVQKYILYILVTLLILLGSLLPIHEILRRILSR